VYFQASVRRERQKFLFGLLQHILASRRFDMKMLAEHMLVYLMLSEHGSPHLHSTRVQCLTAVHDAVRGHCEGLQDTHITWTMQQDAVLTCLRPALLCNTPTLWNALHLPDAALGKSSEGSPAALHTMMCCMLCSELLHRVFNSIHGTYTTHQSKYAGRHTKCA
jgi:hypothetical protein